MLLTDVTQALTVPDGDLIGAMQQASKAWLVRKGVMVTEQPTAQSTVPDSLGS